MLDTLRPLCVPVRQAIMWVRCEERPIAHSSLDFKDEDLTDIIDLYYKIDYCIRAFPLFVNMDKPPDDLMWDFAKTSMIEDNGTVINPFEIKDPWVHRFPQSGNIFLFVNPQAEMSTQEFNKHRLNAKCLSGIKRFDNPQCFVLKTSYERQLETDAILLQVLQLKRSFNRSEETRAALEKDTDV